MANSRKQPTNQVSSQPAGDAALNGMLAAVKLASSVPDEAAVFQVLKNVAVAIQQLLSPFCEVVVHDFSRFAEMDRIYCDYFSAPYPTRNTIGVKELWGGAQVGFDVWAV